MEAFEIRSGILVKEGCITDTKWEKFVRKVKEVFLGIPAKVEPKYPLVACTVMQVSDFLRDHANIKPGDVILVNYAEVISKTSHHNEVTIDGERYYVLTGVGPIAGFVREVV